MQRPILTRGLVFGLTTAVLAAAVLAASFPPGTGQAGYPDNAQAANDKYAAPDLVPDELLIKFGSKLTRDERDKLLASYGGQMVRRVEELDIDVVRFDPAVLSKALLELQKHQAVEYAEQNAYAYALDHNPPDDPNWGLQWALPRIQMPWAWQVNRGSSDIVIAVVDSGVDYTHPDLTGKVILGRDFVGSDSDPWPTTGNGRDDDGDGTIDEGVSHGTHVAGIAAASTNNGQGIAGVCRDCRILALRVLNDDGVGTYDRIASGIVRAARGGARVINLSLGGFVDRRTLRSAVRDAYDRGAVIVAAAGNCGIAIPACGVANRVSYPAAYDRYVIAVANTTATDNLAGTSNSNSYVDIAAPGTSIFSTVTVGDFRSFPGSVYGRMSGTSMAAPHVSGVIGLMLAQGWGRDLILPQLQATADAVPGFAFGRINAGMALNTVYLEVQVALPCPEPYGTGIPVSVSGWTDGGWRDLDTHTLSDSGGSSDPVSRAGRTPFGLFAMPPGRYEISSLDDIPRFVGARPTLSTSSPANLAYVGCY